MADTVTTDLIFDGLRRKTLHLTGQSDGTGETDVKKLDLSTLTNSNGEPATYMTIDRIYGNVSGMRVVLEWDHPSDAVIASLQGDINIDWTASGGKTDRETGGTGDLLLTSNQATDGDSYDLTIELRPKA